ncbi:MAG: PEP-utilizing enzyme [bacterium]|nr:PEP-utilizing enzyme [bacterium]
MNLTPCAPLAQGIYSVRELKTPCIIGTKIATEVLKDGMTVEVDANEGIVKIIMKK